MSLTYTSAIILRHPFRVEEKETATIPRVSSLRSSPWANMHDPVGVALSLLRAQALYGVLFLPPPLQPFGQEVVGGEVLAVEED